MFNTGMPIAKPPTFGVPEREVGELAERLSGDAPARVPAPPTAAPPVKAH